MSLKTAKTLKLKSLRHWRNGILERPVGKLKQNLFRRFKEELGLVFFENTTPAFQALPQLNESFPLEPISCDQKEQALLPKTSNDS